ncbi:AMP-dependent synthetase [Kibdelosporangium aridum]|uniref:AMP-dependent synthetase n=1 Tax=Kibdelosporangium aridum TaxID=2030 RepID=A0A428ZJ14_KIBAR|nr:AMP-binding protein [Kibdelosporangium aridum]RSM87971.1 AMP-dependent synthetase [Kibdelosporangium aridum]
MTSPAQHVTSLLALFGRPEAATAELLCDQHPSDAIAFTVIEPDLAFHNLTFGQLRDQSARFASALTALGVRRGDRVATLLGKSAELVIATLAIWRLGAVQVPLFTALAAPAIATRITGNETRAVITEPAQRAKLGAWPGHVITTGEPADGDISFSDLLSAEPQLFPATVGGDGTIVELYTSGTTGSPKGVLVPLKAVAAMRSYQLYGLDHQESDVFWNAADPGWAYGLYQAIIGPMSLGRRSLLLHSGFSPELTGAVLSEFHVTNFTASPTVYRALRNAGISGLHLRHCSSAGEPLPSDVTSWAKQALGSPVRDHYGQTELGMAVANGWHPDVEREPRPGSMGLALPGWSLDVLRPDADLIAPAGENGRLAVNLAESPMMWFSGYRGAPGRFTQDGRWYLTGDTAAKDADGHIYFSSRDDDIILMAGYRISPHEVENVLLQHNGVAEAAVVGIPDELRGEVLIAYVALRQGIPESVGGELQRMVKTRLAAHVYPREVRFVPALPKTSSGKLQRSVLRRNR